MAYKTKNILIGRKPTAQGDEFKTAIIALFDVNNPHKTGTAPQKVLEYRNIEKIRVTGLDCTYYLEGNDIVVNNLSSVDIDVDDAANIITITGVQGKE
ncbi:hypothetical protein HYU19_05920 [Candidatus Woesearchaeota archaeon]|nr:hypothetical protein [Candidatus Woesearchaeota archaeon]